jgi:transposase
VVLYLPHTDGICFERFLREVRRAVPETPLALVLDGSGSHTNQHIHWPAGVQPIPLPRYSPELNPPERWFEELRKSLANRIFDTIAELETALTEALRCYWDTPAKLVQLTAFPWWREAVQSITSQ